MEERSQRTIKVVRNSEIKRVTFKGGFDRLLNKIATTFKIPSSSFDLSASIENNEYTIGNDESLDFTIDMAKTSSNILKIQVVQRNNKALNSQPQPIINNSNQNKIPIPKPQIEEEEKNSQKEEQKQEKAEPVSHEEKIEVPEKSQESSHLKDNINPIELSEDIPSISEEQKAPLDIDEMPVAGQKKQESDIEDYQYSEISSLMDEKSDQDKNPKSKEKFYTASHLLAKELEHLRDLQPLINKWLRSYSEIERNVQEQNIFQVKCNSCQISPIAGICFKCIICPNYHICSVCESTFDHPHPFIKIKTMEQYLYTQTKNTKINSNYISQPSFPRNLANQEIREDNKLNISPNEMINCEHCGRLVKAELIQGHEKMCSIAFRTQYRKNKNRYAMIKKGEDDQKKADDIVNQTCRHCGRHFQTYGSFSTHEQLCLRVFMTKRPKFDMMMQRYDENIRFKIQDIQQQKKRDEKFKKKNKKGKTPTKKLKNWKLQSQQLRALASIMRAKNPTTIQFNPL